MDATLIRLKLATSAWRQLPHSACCWSVHSVPHDGRLVTIWLTCERFETETESVGGFCVSAT
jgi:hypothetical protein